MDPTTHLGTIAITEAYRAFGNREAHSVSPTYEAWAIGVSEDAAVAELLESLPRGKRQPNLVFAAARLHGAQGTYGEFRATLFRLWPQVRSTILARATQTNEAGRCAILLPFLAELPQPLALLEVGAAAGLCLLPDQYSYRYNGRPELHPDDGPSDVVLPCSISPEIATPRQLPNVVWRAGIDLAPVDVSNDDACTWLETLVWPEHDERRTRLHAALRVARRNPPRIEPGDLLNVLPQLAAEAPGDATLVVFHSAVLSYVDPASRSAFVDIVQGLSGHWISNEGALVLPHTAEVASDRVERGFVVSVDGEPRAYADPHGRSLTVLRNH